jgi:hypothetical protein
MILENEYWSINSRETSSPVSYYIHTATNKGMDEYPAGKFTPLVGGGGGRSE